MSAWQAHPAARGSGTRAGHPPERGAVTAETALALPAVAVVAAVVLGVGHVAWVHLQCVDAARAAARLAARGETAGVVRARAAASAPPGAGVDVTASAGLVAVRVRAAVELPLGLTLPVGAAATADAEAALAGS